MGGGEDGERNLGRFLRGSAFHNKKLFGTSAPAAMRLVTGSHPGMLFVGGTLRLQNSRMSCECEGERVLCVVRV